MSLLRDGTEDMKFQQRMNQSWRRALLWLQSAPSNPHLVEPHRLRSLLEHFTSSTSDLLHPKHLDSYTDSEIMTALHLIRQHMIVDKRLDAWKKKEVACFVAEIQRLLKDDELFFYGLCCQPNPWFRQYLPFSVIEVDEMQDYEEQALWVPMEECTLFLARRQGYAQKGRIRVKYDAMPQFLQALYEERLSLYVGAMTRVKGKVAALELTLKQLATFEQFQFRESHRYQEELKKISPVDLEDLMKIVPYTQALNRVPACAHRILNLIRMAPADTPGLRAPRFALLVMLMKARADPRQVFTALSKIYKGNSLLQLEINNVYNQYEKFKAPQCEKLIGMKMCPFDPSIYKNHSHTLTPTPLHTPTPTPLHAHTPTLLQTPPPLVGNAPSSYSLTPTPLQAQLPLVGNAPPSNSHAPMPLQAPLPLVGPSYSLVDPILRRVGDCQSDLLARHPTRARVNEKIGTNTWFFIESAIRNERNRKLIKE